jgi:imidazolonepropionase-like amidohydrolase
MPGLWDVHIHPDYLSADEMPLADQVTLFGHRLATALTESGIVGMRCAGTHSFMDVAWKRAFDTGQHVGPRLFASGHFLTTTGGHFLTSGHAMEVDGPYGWVKAIREQIKNGVDHIKLNLSGGIMGPAWDLHTHSFLLDDEIRAAFEICRKRGFKVMAHATNPEAVKNAIRLGAHSVEHGYIMDDECIALLLEHETWYVPTLAISHLTASQATNSFKAAWVAERALPHALCCRAEAASDVHATWFKKALGAGVRMALGSDIRPLKEATLLEMGLWVRDGATPWQTLVAATRHGAEICGVGAELGTVEVGKLADLIVVAANPLEDINNVRRLQLVLREGRVVSDKRDLGGEVP